MNVITKKRKKKHKSYYKCTFCYNKEIYVLLGESMRRHWIRCVYLSLIRSTDRSEILFIRHCPGEATRYFIGIDEDEENEDYNEFIIKTKELQSFCGNAEDGNRSFCIQWDNMYCAHHLMLYGFLYEKVNIYDNNFGGKFCPFDCDGLVYRDSDLVD